MKLCAPILVAVFVFGFLSSFILFFHFVNPGDFTAAELHYLLGGFLFGIVFVVLMLYGW